MNQQEFRRLYDMSFRLIDNALKRYPLTKEEREDILQATFFTFWVYSQTEVVEKPIGFLVTSARNRAITLFRQRKTQRHDSLENHGELTSTVLASGHSGGAEAQDLRERKIERVREALEIHTARTGNDTLWKRYTEGRRLKDIAQERGEPLGTICARVNAARLPRKLVETLRADMRKLGDATA